MFYHPESFFRSENAEGTIGKDQYAVAEMALTVHPESVNFPDALSGELNYQSLLYNYIMLSVPAGQTIEARMGNAAFHPTNLNNTYTCRSEEEVHMNDTTAPQPVVARMRNVQMEAFRQKTDDSFSTGEKSLCLLYK